MANILGRSFGSDTVAKKTPDGDWEVVVTMVEKRLVDGSSDWEEKTISTSCTDPVFETAYDVAMNATLEKFKDILELTQSGGMFENDEQLEITEVKE